MEQALTSISNRGLNLYEKDVDEHEADDISDYDYDLSPPLSFKAKMLMFGLGLLCGGLSVGVIIFTFL